MYGLKNLFRKESALKDLTFLRVKKISVARDIFLKEDLRSDMPYTLEIEHHSPGEVTLP